VLGAECERVYCIKSIMAGLGGGVHTAVRQRGEKGRVGGSIVGFSGRYSKV